MNDIKRTPREVRAKAHIARPLNFVWALASDFAAVHCWAEGINKCWIEGNADPEAPGAIRVLKMVGDITVRERLEKRDPTAKRLEYSIVDGPLPFKSYYSTIQVSAKGPQESTVEWSCVFEPLDDLDPAEVTRQLKTMYEAGLAGLARALGLVA